MAEPRPTPSSLRPGAEERGWLAELQSSLLTTAFSVVLSPGPRLQFVLSSVESLLGYSADELIAEYDWRQLVAPEDAAAVAKAIANAMKVGSGIVSGRLVRRSGELVRVQARLTVVRDASGAATRIDGQLWRDEPLLALQQLLDDLPDPVIVSDRDGLIVAASVRISAFGYTPESLTGQPVELLVPASLRERHRARRATYDAHRAPRASIGAFFALSATGEEIPVDISLGPLAGTDLVVAVLRDLRTQRRLEALSLWSERRFRATFEQVGVGLAHVAPDGRWTSVNHKLCEITGYSETELLAIDDEAARQLCDTDVRSRLLAGDRSSAVRELRFVRKDGRAVWLRNTCSVARAPDGAPEYFVNVVEDIDLQRRSEELLRHAQRLDSLGRMAGGIAHDFNNLLAVILSYSEGLSNDPTLPDEPRGEAREIFNTARRAAQLTRKLLTFSRHQKPEVQALDCAEQLRQLDGLLRPLLGRDVAWSWHVEDEATVLADPGQFEQVVVNLVVNARDAVPPGSTVSVFVRKQVIEEDDPHGRPAGSFVALEVRDSGPGIPPDVLPHIFEPFFTTKGPGAGTGLGLAIVESIVHQAGGHIDVRSRPGETVFTVLLPMAAQAAGPGPWWTPPPEVRGQGERLLVVEDDPDVRRALSATLLDAGYSVTAAANGAEALFLFSQAGEHFDAVVTDVEMPLVSGTELTDRLASLGRELRIAFVTGHPDTPAPRLPGVRCTVIAKPFSRARLLSGLNQLLRPRE